MGVMATFKFRTHTGPTTVKEVARRMRSKGIDAHAGTEHVYGEISAKRDYEALDELNEAAGFRLVRASDLRTAATHRGEADETAADELVLYLDNERDLYEQKRAIAANMLRKMERGAYDHQRAPDAWMYVVENAARKYAKEFAVARDWSAIFNVPTRALAAKQLADRYRDNVKHGFEDEF